MKIRIADSNDIDYISKLDSFWTENQFKEELDNPFSSIFVIDSDNNNNNNNKEKKIVGFIAIRLLDGFCDIMNIAVHKDFRNNGIGTLLLSHILNNIQCNSFNLEVSNNNISAIKLYKKAGFNAIHVRKNYYINSDAIIMQKLI